MLIVEKGFIITDRDMSKLSNPMGSTVIKTNYRKLDSNTTISDFNIFPESIILFVTKLLVLQKADKQSG